MKAANLQWLWLKTRSRLRTALARQFYRDPGPEIARSILVAGTARSGTTWLANIIDAQLGCRILFEPFHPKVEAYEADQLFPYVRPGEQAPRLHQYAERVLRGQIRDPWIDSEATRLWPKYRLIKDVRLNLVLKWFCDTFPEVPVLLIVRHPCAVVLSRMEAGWEADGDIQLDALARPAPA